MQNNFKTLIILLLILNSHDALGCEQLPFEKPETFKESIQKSSHVIIGHQTNLGPKHSDQMPFFGSYAWIEILGRDFISSQEFVASHFFSWRGRDDAA